MQTFKQYLEEMSWGSAASLAAKNPSVQYHAGIAKDRGTSLAKRVVGLGIGGMAGGAAAAMYSGQPHLVVPTALAAGGVTAGLAVAGSVATGETFSIAGHTAAAGAHFAARTLINKFKQEPKAKPSRLTDRLKDVKY